jgi:hypothetical protein
MRMVAIKYKVRWEWKEDEEESSELMSNVFN